MQKSFHIPSRSEDSRPRPCRSTRRVGWSGKDLANESSARKLYASLVQPQGREVRTLLNDNPKPLINAADLASPQRPDSRA